MESLTAEVNWEAYGTATAEETSQFFMDIIDDMQLSACGGGGNMQSIQTVTYQIISQTSITTAGTYFIDHADLPAEASQATALLLQISLYFQGSGELVVRDDTTARQSRQYNGEGDILQIVAPINSGTIRINMTQDDPPETHSIIVSLIGWW